MWTEITTGLRYASDLTDAEWRVIEPQMPPPKALGRPGTTDLREVVNAILYVFCARAVPGVCFRRTSRRVRRCSAISPRGEMISCGRASIAIF